MQRLDGNKMTKRYLARSAASEQVPPQSYLEHVLHVLVRGNCYLCKVLHYARDWDAKAVRRIFEIAAEYHDLGKLVDANQRVLSGEKKAAHLPLPHADAGVAHLIELDAWPSALLVYAHHVGLPDIGEINMRGMRNCAIEQQMDCELPELLARHERSVRPSIIRKSPPESNPELQSADVRVLFACLTHADHGDAARAMNEEPQHTNPPKLRAAERLEALQNYSDKLASDSEESERNQLRSAFFAACRDSQHEDPITICDAPVGTGKTTAVMASLLTTAARQGLRRVFVILPFTNIITQSVKTYRQALTLADERASDVVAEIHHRADFKDLSSRKLTALWDAPIVVTTAVAFFETLASASPATLRRLQNLPGSAIFLDEAHAMLPPTLLPLAWRWIRHAAKTWSCRWVLASGSLCHFWTLEEFGDTSIRLPNILPEEQRSKLHGFEISRVHHRYRQDPMSLDDLAVWLKELDGPIIVVLNTVHTAAAAARAAKRVFGEGNVMHLSTSLTPQDRETTLALVKARLRYKTQTKWCLFATSCVEAGVDLSFRTGVRECASLLSVLQLAGRVNRNSEYASADVWTATLNANDSGVTKNPSLNISARILREFFENGTEISPALCTEALKREIRETASISANLVNAEINYAFETVEKEFMVIDDDSQLAVADMNLVKRIQNFEDVSWQEIQTGSVRIRKNIRDRLAIEESSRYPGVLLWTAEYTPFLGYMAAVLDLVIFDANGGAII